MEAQKNWAVTIGAILLLIGLAGFFTGDTILGFGINALHNVVHLITGGVFLWAGLAQNAVNAKPVNQWLGVIYIVVGILGFFGVLGFLNVNAPDNWLHLIIGAISAGIGWKAM